MRRKLEVQGQGQGAEEAIVGKEGGAGQEIEEGEAVFSMGQRNQLKNEKKDNIGADSDIQMSRGSSDSNEDVSRASAAGRREMDL